MNEGLSITLQLLQSLQHPEQKFKSIHLAGTNGKGSSSHYLASIFQEAGYKTGLFTSPHIKSFTERIKINGKAIPEQVVVDFVQKHRPLFDRLHPSFFEMTTAMAFDYFANENVDIAIIETGLGGRLDSTNVITPLLSLITNIGLDHTEILGDTLEKIALEKAGIAKKNVPLLISEKQSCSHVITDYAQQIGASSITFAEDLFQVHYQSSTTEHACFEVLHRQTSKNTMLYSELMGSYQKHNLTGVLAACERLKNTFTLTEQHIEQGIRRVIQNTQLKGRWQVLQQQPMVICDAVHNIAGWNSLLDQLLTMSKHCAGMVLGFSNDKKPHLFLEKIPKHIPLYLTSFNNKRSCNAYELQELALSMGFQAFAFENVNTAIAQAIVNISKEELIFVGGSIYMLAEIHNL
jgi:dihydrofolate synthase/folylpolyglutamate synthase